MFAHLHVHSNYSFLRGASRVGDLVAAAKARGMQALAITDTNGMYGVIPFYRACIEQGIKPIIGTELVVGGNAPLALVSEQTQGAANVGREPNPAGMPGAAIFLARNRAGYAELCKIVTARHLSEHFDLFTAICQASENVIVIVGERSLAERLQEYGHRPRVYLELHPAENAAQARRRDEIARWAGGRLIPIVAANDVHFANPHEYRIHQVLRAIDNNTSVESLPASEFAGIDCWLKPLERMKQEIGPWEPAIVNAAKIAGDCNVELELGKTRFPKFATPPGETAESWLRAVAYGGARRKYGTLADVVRHRVDYELSVIIAMGYADYFLIVWDIVEEAKRRGVPIVGRGSAADSIVAYVLDITRVDPIEHNLYFERFLNPQRKDPPDIDLDFCWRRRDEMLQYVFDKYGEDRVAMISTHNTFGARSAIRDIARALGLSPGEISVLAARLPYGGVEDVEHAVATMPEYRGLPIDREPLKSILDIGRAIDGFPRHLSIHAGGLVIAHGPITDFVPLQYAAKGVIITQYDMHPIEDLGLVKMDLLGQRSLSVIDDTVKAVRHRHGVEVDIEALPADDEATMQLFRTGATIGCFQVESPGMRQLLQKLRADNFEIITAASSVIRPGPADTGMAAAFILRYLGKEPAAFLHPKLEPILRETFGVMLYQEDILKVASAIGGMSLGEADNLRRSMSKKRGYEGIAQQRERFLSGAKANGIADDVAAEIWRQVEGFAGYAFCKAHSASYARLSWQAGYLKAHWPAEFMAAVLANRGGYYGTWAYVEEARRLGIGILPPSVNRSEPVFTAEGNAVRTGLSFVKSLTTRAVESILSQRAARGFRSMADFLRRVPISLRECESLIECGGMDDLGQGNRPQKLWRLQTLHAAVRREQKAGVPAAGLFGIDDEADAPVPDIPDYPLAAKLNHERRVLDFCVTAHPLSLFEAEYDSGRFTKATELHKFANRYVTIAGVVISTKGTTTASNERMKFISLEDRTGVVEVVFFPDVYRRFAHVLSGGFLAVTGRVTEDETAITIEAQSVESLRFEG